MFGVFRGDDTAFQEILDLLLLKKNSFDSF